MADDQVYYHIMVHNSPEIMRTNKQLQSSPDTYEMDEMYHVPLAICEHDICTLSDEGLIICVKCNQEM